VEDRRQWVVETAEELCESLGYKRAPKVLFMEDVVDGFRFSMRVATHEKVDKGFVELPEPELRIAPDLLDRFSERQFHHLLAQTLVHHGPREQRRRQAWPALLGTIPVVSIFGVVALIVRYGWIGVLALPVPFVIIPIEVAIVAPFMMSQTKATLDAIDLTADAATPIENMRKRLSQPYQGGPWPIRALCRAVDSRSLKLLEREATRRGYRTRSLPDA
jgi:hypothetical protein